VKLLYRVLTGQTRELEDDREYKETPEVTKKSLLISPVKRNRKLSETEDSGIAENSSDSDDHSQTGNRTSIGVDRTEAVLSEPEMESFWILDNAFLILFLCFALFFGFSVAID